MKHKKLNTVKERSHICIFFLALLQLSNATSFFYTLSRCIKLFSDMNILNQKYNPIMYKIS